MLRYPLNISTGYGALPPMYIDRYRWDLRFDGLYFADGGPRGFHTCKIFIYLDNTWPVQMTSFAFYFSAFQFLCLTLTL